MNLRPARLSDAALLLAWRNDPATRAASHQTAEVPFESHLAWLSNALENPSRRLMVAEVDGLAVGTVRVDSEASGHQVLSWTIAPEQRGKGLAHPMLMTALNLVGRPVRAEVRADNLPSIRVAEKIGMRLIGEIEGVRHYRLEAPVIGDAS